MQHIQDFVVFWKSYPKKAGKIDAQKAYDKARTQASAAEILDGVAVYIANKPAWQEWAHPGSWLRAGRWMDEYAPTAKPAPAEDWWDECKRLHDGTCQERLRHHHRMAIDKSRAS